MSWYARLFSGSPFEPLVDHQALVLRCARLTRDLINAALIEDAEQVKELAKRISTLEYEADVVKNRIRDNLPTSIRLPVSRADVLDVLSAQDSVADAAEDLGVLFTMRPMEVPPDEVKDLLRELVDASLAVVERATDVVTKLGTIARLSFARQETQRVLTLVDLVDREEHLADKIQDQLAKAFFRHEDHFKPAAIVVWMKIFNKVGDLANYSEKMTHRIRLLLSSQG